VVTNLSGQDRRSTLSSWHNQHNENLLQYRESLKLLNICATEQNIRNYSFHPGSMDASAGVLSPPTQSQSAGCAKIAAQPLALEASHYE